MGDARRIPPGPREHGAWAMVGYPLASGLALGGVSLAGAGFAVMVVTAFLAYASGSVLLGMRGARLRASLGPRARASLRWLAPLGLAGGIGFLMTAPSRAVALAGLSVVLALAVAGMVALRRVRTLWGETLAAVALASVHLPIAAAGGASGPSLWVPAAVWALAFALATVTVHSLKVRSKGRGAGGWTVPVAPVLAAMALGLAVAAPVVGPSARAVAAMVPVAMVLLGLSLAPVHARHLKRVGWTLVGVDAATLILLAALLRG